MEMNGWWDVLVGATLTVLAFGVATIGGFVLAAYLLLKIPTDYFAQGRARAAGSRMNPFVRFASRTIKNLLGAGLFVTGAALSLPGIPGPGLVLMLFGVMLLEFPGKAGFERWLVGGPAVIGAINRLRVRYGKPPMMLTSASGSSWPEPEC
jgi:hypothetical protein